MLKKMLKKMVSSALAVTCACGSVVWGTSCSSFEPTAEIVNKNGASAVVTFVIDDGNHDTGTFSKEMMEKYEHLTFTYALWTKDFATLTETEDGTEYVMENIAKECNIKFKMGEYDETTGATSYSFDME